MAMRYEDIKRVHVLEAKGNEIFQEEINHLYSTVR